MMTEPTHSESYERGIEIRRAVLGDKHVDNGVTAAEVQETLLQAAVYAGAPAALESFRVAEKVLKEMEQDV
jgi:4-carboxymuconolactone decarboxylase